MKNVPKIASNQTPNHMESYISDVLSITIRSMTMETKKQKRETKCKKKEKSKTKILKITRNQSEAKIVVSVWFRH